VPVISSSSARLRVEHRGYSAATVGSDNGNRHKLDPTGSKHERRWALRLRIFLGVGRTTSLYAGTTATAESEACGHRRESHPGEGQIELLVQRQRQRDLVAGTWPTLLTMLWLTSPILGLVDQDEPLSQLTARKRLLHHSCAARPA
jgi:hypothetical protein